jgi:glucokinase
VILAGDVGGTNTRLALFDSTNGGRKALATKTFPSSEQATFSEIVAAFLSTHPTVKLRRACFGVAGPVRNQRCKPTNLDWEVNGGQLAQDFNIPRVDVINDLVANAHGIAWLGEKDYDTINEGVVHTGNGAVISAGTGLGEAGLFWDGKQHRPFASEGGHAEFGPRNELEIELVNYLEKKLDRVSYESVLSGPGIVNIYSFLRDCHFGQPPGWLVEEMENSDQAGCIARAAIDARSPLCEKTLEMFLEIYGAEAGNLALKMMAVGGIWLGGGIVVKLVDALKSSPAFMSGFTSKGKLSHLVEGIPVRVILNDQAALLGAAKYALESLE